MPGFGTTGAKPSGETLYLKTKLSDEVAQPIVGVFVPSRLVLPANYEVDIIVYLHGNIIDDCGTNPGQFEERGIEYYWNTPLFQNLRTDLEQSGVNAILVAPTLSVRFGSSDLDWAPRYGNLNLHNQFDFLINDVLDKLGTMQAIPAAARVGNIVLAAHSSGGLPMQRILAATNTLHFSITECWGFECLYFGTDIWKAWLSTNADNQFHHFRQTLEMVPAVGKLKPLTNFSDIRGGKSHCALLQQFWRIALVSSAVLKQSPTAPAVVVATTGPTAVPPAPRPGLLDLLKRAIGR